MSKCAQSVIAVRSGCAVSAQSVPIIVLSCIGYRLEIWGKYSDTGVGLSEKKNHCCCLVYSGAPWGGELLPELIKDSKELSQPKIRGRRTGGSRGYWGVGFMNTDWAVTAFTAVNVTTSLALDGQRTSHPQEWILHQLFNPSPSLRGKKFQDTYWAWGNLAKIFKISMSRKRARVKTV